MMWKALPALVVRGLQSGGKEKQRRGILPHLLLTTSPGHLAWERYGHSREHVNHPGRAGSVPS